MAHPPRSNPSNSPTDPAEALRRLAYSGIYLLPGAVEKPEALAPRAAHIPDAEETLAALRPEDRDRAIHMALRRLAFQMLYELDHAGAAADAEKIVAATLPAVTGIGPVAIEQTQSLILGAHNARAAADEEFKLLAPEWPTHRLAAVDRAILRLAHYEMSSGRTPHKIVINEAVELAKHFSTDKSAPFINALLDRVLKRLDPTHIPSDLPLDAATS